MIYVAVGSAFPRPVQARPLPPHRVDPSAFLDRSGFPELVVHTSLWSSWMGLNIATLAYQDREVPVSLVLMTPLAITGATVVGAIILTHEKPALVVVEIVARSPGAVPKD